MKKRNAGAIFVLNLLLGWTVIGWIVALVWALTVDSAPQAQNPWTCPACHRGIQPGDRFCRSCAAPVGSTAR